MSHDLAAIMLTLDCNSDMITSATSTLYNFFAFFSKSWIKRNVSADCDTDEMLSQEVVALWDKSKQLHTHGD